MDWNAKVKEVREKLLLTQAEFAKLLGVSFATVNRWENSKTEPTMKTKRKIRALCEKNGIRGES